MPTEEIDSKSIRTIKLAFALSVVLLVLFATYLIGIFHGVSMDASRASESLTTTPVELEPSSAIANRIPGMLEAINAYRGQQNLPALKLNGELSNSAQAKADDLVQHNYWAHFRDGKSPWDFFKAAGYNYSKAGENLARCFSDNSLVVPAWIASSAHRAELVGDYKDVGFGIALNPVDHCNYVVAHFGTEADL